MRDNQPSKMRKINYGYSILCFAGFGPTFGGGRDIYICNSANERMGSYSNLGVSYQHPLGNETEKFLAGSYKFQLSEIEAFQKE